MSIDPVNEPDRGKPSSLPRDFSFTPAETPSLETNRKIFSDESFAAIYQAMQPAIGEAYYLTAKDLLACVPGHTKGAVLEVGAGSGEATRALFDVGDPNIVYSTDQSASMLRHLKALFGIEPLGPRQEALMDTFQIPKGHEERLFFQEPKEWLSEKTKHYSQYANSLNTYCIPTHELGDKFPKESFDLIFGNDLIHWLGKFHPEEDYQYRSLRAMASLLKGDGRVAFGTPFQFFENPDPERYQHETNPFLREFNRAFNNEIHSARAEILGADETTLPRLTGVGPIAKRGPYNKHSLEEAFGEAGLELVEIQIKTLYRGPQSIIGQCIGSTHMEIAKLAERFEPEVLQKFTTTGVREQMIEDAFASASEEVDPYNQEPHAVVHAHIVGKKL